MALGWPLALLGLAALAVPLLIHLLQQGESRRVEFASTRWLRATPLKQRRRLRLEHPWLLLLRALLLVAAVVLLAQPYLQLAPVGGAQTIVLVSPRVDSAAARAALAEDWSSATQRLWLAPGFAAIGEAAPSAAFSDWSLAAQADAELPADATLRVVAAADAAGTRPRRPPLSGRMQVTLLPAARAAVPVDAPPPEIVIVADAAGSAEDMQWSSRAHVVARLREVLAVWQHAGVAMVARDATPDALPPGASWLVWLSAAQLPSGGEGARTIVVPGGNVAALADAPPTVPAAGAAQWLREARRGRDRWIVTGAAFADGSVDTGTAAETLLAALIGDAAQWPTASYPLTSEQWFAGGEATAAAAPLRLPLTNAMAWLIALLFAAERVASARVAAGRAHA